MRVRSLILAVLIGGCGGGAAATLPDLSAYSSSRLASRELCEQAVSNYEKEAWEAPLFDRRWAELEHRRRVDQCTITFSERKAACYALAPSLQYVHNCQMYAELQ